MTTPHILIVEDDRDIGLLVAKYLKSNEMRVSIAENGRAMDRILADTRISLIVLDRMLPGGLDGLGVLATLRTAGVESPVLILSALSGVDERIRGLRAGGDDYLTKPFDFLELTARLDVLLRRHAGVPQCETMLRVGQLVMDLLTRTVSHAGKPVELLPREYRLLECLMRHAGQVVTRTMLFEDVWNYHHIEPTNVIDVHIGKLRRKIDPDGAGSMIQTVRGAGYILRAPR